MVLEVLTGDLIEGGYSRMSEFVSFKDLTPTKIVLQYLYGGDMNDVRRIEAKNDILLNMIQRLQTKELGIRVKHKCTSCDGLGFDVNIFSVEEVKCPDCRGTGFKIAECTRCGGTGKMGEVPCYTCRGRGTYLYKKTNRYPGKKCLSCSGSGITKKLVQKTDELKLCSSCKGTGVSRVASNPVLDPEIGKSIMELVISKE